MIRDIITPLDVASRPGGRRTVTPPAQRPGQPPAAAQAPDDLADDLYRGERGPSAAKPRRAPAKPSAPPAVDAGPVPAVLVEEPKPDNWYKKLLKYTPAEAIAFYLALDGLCRSAVPDKVELRGYLGVTLLLSVIFSWMFLAKFWKVRRFSTKLLSTVALVAYVFAIGGMFATFDFYRPWHGTAVVLITATFLSLWDPPGTIAEA